MALVGLVPLLWLLRDSTPRRGLAIGLAFGIAYFGAVLYWILLFGELAWSALTLASAAFVAAFGALAPLLWRRNTPVASTFALAALWTVLEWVRAMVPLGGFTWGGLGTTQAATPTLLPLASVAGAWGIAFVVVAVNGLVLLAAERVRSRPAAAAALVAAAVALVVLPALIPLPAPSGRPLSVASVQMDVRPAAALDAAAEDRAIAREHARLHRRLDGAAPDLVVWGESSIDPGANDPGTSAAIRAAIRRVGAPTLVNTTRPGGDGRLRRDAVLLTGDGTESDSYSKVHLVPFGEFVPWRNALGWISALRQIPYDLAPGDRIDPLRGAGLPPIGAVVCYENSFPGIERELARRGAQLLVVQTNNASYGDTSASEQHLLMTRLRAVEQGRWAIHAAISGISAVVDPTGRVVAQAGLFRPAVLRARVQASSALTIYGRLGDWLPWLSLATVLAVAATPRGRRRERGAPRPLPATAPTLVVLPTYDERETIEWMLQRLLAGRERLDLVVVDDSSPDRTAELVRAIAAREPRVRLIERDEKAGLAGAYLAGFAMGVREGYDLIVEMDADLSHDPEQLSRLLAAARDHDVVIGSRYVPGGSIARWSPWRRLLSRAGNAYARLALGFPLRDATSGYRVYRREALEELLAEPVRSDGYGFQIELAFRAWTAGFRVAEVPISFREREHGRSKISRRIVLEALWRVTGWGIRARFAPPTHAASADPTSSSAAGAG